MQNANDFVDISENLTIEQMVARAYRHLPPEHQAEYSAISRRSGIPLNNLLIEALHIYVEKVKREGDSCPGSTTIGTDGDQ